MEFDMSFLCNIRINIWVKMINLYNRYCFDSMYAYSMRALMKFSSYEYLKTGVTLCQGSMIIVNGLLPNSHRI